MKDDLVVSDLKAFLNAKKAAKNVGITNNTLNKYSQILEGYGYVFKKEGNKIAYLEKDMVILRKLKELAVSGGMNVHEAAKAVITMFDASSPALQAEKKAEAVQQKVEKTQENQVFQEKSDVIQKKLEVTKELEASKQEIAASKPKKLDITKNQEIGKKSELTKKELAVPKPVSLEAKKGTKNPKLIQPTERVEKIEKVEKAEKVEKVEKFDKGDKADKADNSSVNMESIEEKLDKAIKFITERETSTEELKKLLDEKDLIIDKLKQENANYQKEKEVINLRDKVLLETIRKRQEERKNSSAQLSFWEKRKKG